MDLIWLNLHHQIGIIRQFLCPVALLVYIVSTSCAHCCLFSVPILINRRQLIDNRATTQPHLPKFKRGANKGWNWKLCSNMAVIRIGLKCCLQDNCEYSRVRLQVLTSLSVSLTSLFMCSTCEFAHTSSPLTTHVSRTHSNMILVSNFACHTSHSHSFVNLRLNATVGVLMFS